MEKFTFIYGLKEKNNIVRYVGKSDNLFIRLQSHILESKRLNKTKKHRWINKILNDGKELEIVVLEKVRYDDWQIKEIFWINKFKNNDLTNHTKGGCGGTTKKYLLSYFEVKNWVEENLSNIKSQTQWNKIKKDLPFFIPKKPNVVYEKNGWVNWADFLNSNNISNKLKKFISYDEAKIWLKNNLNIKNQNDWSYSTKNNLIPEFIPKSPEHVYKNSGWINWADFLNSNNISPVIKNKNYLSLYDLKKIAIDNNIKSKKGWVDYVKSLNNEKIPQSPQKTYKNKGWVSWLDFLSKPEKKFMSFNEAKLVVFNLKIKNNKEWRDKIKDKTILNNIPTNPDKFYKNEWISWDDWLGK
jgi:hypothetical protein